MQQCLEQHNLGTPCAKVAPHVGRPAGQRRLWSPLSCALSRHPQSAQQVALLHHYFPWERGQARRFESGRDIRAPRNHIIKKNFREYLGELSGLWVAEFPPEVALSSFA